MDSAATLARNLELIRIAKGYTHEHLAIDAEIARSHISNIKNLSHSATLALVDRLARTLEVEPWLLLVPDLVVESVPEAEAATIEPRPDFPPLKVVKNQTSKRKLRS
jgi:transcriptional regulator with XRE-family HTH domain